MNVTKREYKLSELVNVVSGNDCQHNKVEFGEYKKICVIKASPFLHGADITARAVIYADGEPAAAEYRWPVDLYADDDVLSAESGGESYTVEKYRKESLGLDLWMRPLSAPFYLSAGCGMSQIAAKILKRLGRTMFYMPRMIALIKSSSVLKAKLGNCVGSILSPLVDAGLWSFRMIQKGLVNCRLHGLVVRLVDIDDDECLGKIAELIVSDNRRFGEVHNKAWLKWHMGFCSHGNEPARVLVFERNGELVAFTMLKKKFYETASARGFKNVMLGSVIEWQVKDSCRKLLPSVISQAVLWLGKDGCDAVEVVSDDAVILSACRRSLMVQVGQGNFGVTVGKKSPLMEHEGWCDQHNWRLRPAMCDNGIG